MKRVPLKRFHSSIFVQFITGARGLSPLKGRQTEGQNTIPAHEKTDAAALAVNGEQRSSLISLFLANGS